VQCLLVGLHVRGAPGEVVEGVLGDADDVALDERRALGRALLGMLEGAFPLEHRPAVVVVLGELGEDRAEIDVPVAQRAKAPRALDPALEARVDALAPVRVELGVLDVEGVDALVVDVDEVEVVELLQHEVRGVVIDAAARVAADALEQHLERRAVHDVLIRMQLEADVDAGVVVGVEDRLPAPGELVERGLDQSGRARRPGVHVGPRQPSRERHAGLQAEILRGLRGSQQLLHRPALAGLRVAAHRWCGEAVEARVVGGMHRDELPLQVRRELRDLDARLAADARQLVAIGLRARRLVEVEEPRVPGRDLNALVPERSGPACDRRE